MTIIETIIFLSLIGTICLLVNLVYKKESSSN